MLVYCSGCPRIDPANVRYSQDSVAGTFTDGRRIEHTFRQLLNRDISVDNIPPIQVIKDESGVYWALTGNRRLYVFKRLQSLGIVSDIPVDVQSVDNNSSRFRDRMTTVNNGTDITVRQLIAVRQIDDIEAEWLRTTGRQKSIICPAAIICPVVQSEMVSNMSRLSILQPRQTVEFRKVEEILEHYRRQKDEECEKREEAQPQKRVDIAAEQRLTEKLVQEEQQRRIAFQVQRLTPRSCLKRLDSCLKRLEELLETERQETERREAERQQHLARQRLELQCVERLERKSVPSSSYYKSVDGKKILITRQSGG